MAEQNGQCGGLCGSPAVIVVALVAAIVLPVSGFCVAKLMGGKQSGDLGEEAVLRRIQPAAQVALAAPAPAAAPAAGGAAAADSGKKTYDAACGACHGSGAAGAPKLGDKAAWGPRLGAGVSGLTANAIKGKGAMPPKGGNLSLSDADIKAAVEYMAAAAK
ncbi:MAG: cytochrome c5 family protein [Betaproteobacteria bacterium]|nr:cytochrome c5 family protein [Betaproteobacteria bacterium]